MEKIDNELESEMSEEQRQLALLLKDKRTLLTAPGFAYNDLYYSALNSTISVVESTENYGRTNYSLTSPTFGGTAQIQIPNNSFLSDCSLYLQLPPVPANVYLPRGWGFAAISQISYLMGSSNVPNLSITGQSLFQRVMYEIETEEKRSEIINLAGEEQLTTTTTVVEAYMVIPLPFSHNSGLHPKLPYDTSMLSSPITIQIQFHQLDKFIGGSGASAYASQFSQAKIYLKQSDLTNKELSIGRMLKQNPDKIYTYPFIHAQSYSSSNIQGAGYGSQVSIPLQSFINADLVGLSFGLVKTSDLAAAGGTNVVRPFNYDRIRNVTLQYNGLSMYDSPAQMYRLWNVSKQVGSGYVLNTLPSSGTTSPFTSTPINTYPIFIDFSRLRSVVFEGQYQNVWRIPNQTLTLNFETSATATYTLFATYYYNGAIESSGGESRIYFD